jgi:hypothetical protein
MDVAAQLDSTWGMTIKSSARLGDRLPQVSGASRGDASQAPYQSLVVVQTAWNGWRTALVNADDLQDIRWAQPAGAPRPLIHATVSCQKLVSGTIPHECHRTPTPHMLVVCLLKSHLADGVFRELSRRADERRVFHASAHDSQGSTSDHVSPRTAGRRASIASILAATAAILSAFDAARRRRRPKPSAPVSSSWD